MKTPGNPPLGARRKPERRSPKASITLWRFSLLWLDLWDNRYGLDLEFEGSKHRYGLAFGFGQGAKAHRGPA